MPDVHAKHSPSHASIWGTCTAAPSLEAGIPDKGSPYAAEGTLAHAIAELKVLKKFTPMSLTEYKNKLGSLKNDPLYQPKMDGYTDQYVDEIVKICHAFPSKPYTVSHSTFIAEIPVEERETQPVVTEIITAPVVDVPDDIIVYDDEGNVISETQDTTEPAIVEPTKHGEYAVGGITGLGGQIEDCYVEDFSITANLEDYILYAGGISGSGGGARFYDPKGTNTPESYGGTIQGCAVIWASMQSELAAGGIAGEASTNAEHAMISNCYTKTLSFDVGVYQNTEKVKDGAVGGIVGTDGNESNGHLIMNCVSPSDNAVIGSRTLSRFDDTVRLAPDYAFYQENILSVINRNAVHPDAAKEIFTGSFKFDSNHFTNNGNAVAYPVEIEALFANTIEEGQDG